MPETMSPREKVADRGVVGAIMDALWPILGGNHMPAETWSEINDAILSALASSGDHAELARLAEAATPGPWSLKEGSTPYPECEDTDSWSAILTPRGHEVLTLYERYGVKGEDRSDYDDDARFIAAASPATVLSLIAEVAALRASASVIEPELGDLEATNADLSARLTEAERKLAEARVGTEFIARLLPCAAGLDDAPDNKVIAFYINMRELRQARTFLSKEAERG